VQDKYVGDIGDYGKFGLLRHLFPSPRWRLGIIWYLVPNEAEKKDGRHIDYLENPKVWKQYDPVVFDELKRVVDSNRRWVSDIDMKRLFGTKPVCYVTRLKFGPADSEEGRLQRRQDRKQWIAGAVEAVKDCNAIFLDPDNGVEAPSVDRHAKEGPKFAYVDEIATLASQERVCVVYHHLGKDRPHQDTMRRVALQLRDGMERNGFLTVLRFGCISCRAYFILATQQTKDEIAKRIKEFLQTSWNRCFEMVEV
jgi:hypothetical protein